MELEFHYEVYKKDGTYFAEGDCYMTTTIGNVYELVAVGYIYDYPSKSEKIAKMIKKAETISRKVVYNEYGLWYNQFNVEVELKLENSDEIHSNKFIDGFFKWYIKEVYEKNNDILYDEYGPAHFIEDAIEYFKKYYDGNLDSWVWERVRKYSKN